MTLNELLQNIKSPDTTAAQACTARFDAVAKPLNGLGKLETMLAQIAAVQGTANITLANKCVLVFCADNGVTAQGVTQCSSEVTTSIAKMLAAKKSSVCTMAQACGAHVFTMDIGMQATVQGIENHKIAAGTQDITLTAAMSRAQAVAALLAGAEQVRKRAAEGYTLMAVGEAGIGNTTTAACVAAALLRVSAAAVTGRGSGLSDAGLQRKQAAIEKALTLHTPNPADPLEVLAKVGGFDIAAMCGAFLGAAAYGVTLVVDGAISAAAALAAVRIDARVASYLLPSHISQEPASRLLCEALGFAPILNGDFKLGEGTGAVALFPLLDLALAVYEHSATFADLEMEAYQKQC